MGLAYDRPGPMGLSHEIPKSTEEVGQQLPYLVILKKYSCSLIMKIWCIQQWFEIVPTNGIRGNPTAFNGRHLYLLSN